MNRVRNFSIFLLTSLFYFLFGFPYAFAQINSPIVISELMPHPLSGADWVEVSNIADSDADISGWYLEDTSSTVKVFEPSTVVKAKSSCFVNVSNRLNNGGDEIRLFNSQGILLDPANSQYPISYSSDPGENKSLVRNPDGSLSVSENPTKPDTECLPLSPPSADTNSQQKTLSFSSPSAVTAGQEFSVNVTFANFEPGTYALKILVGKDGSFIYGNTKGSSGWLTQNGKWGDMPQLAVSSTSASTTIKSKVDDDATSGNYAIAVNVAEKSNDGSFSTVWSTKDLATKPLTVTSAPTSSSKSSSLVSSVSEPDSSSEDSSSNIVLAPDKDGESGEVLGSSASELGPPKLNFYIILGIFGLLVGILGLAVARMVNGQGRKTRSKKRKRGSLRSKLGLLAGKLNTAIGRKL